VHAVIGAPCAESRNRLVNGREEQVGASEADLGIHTRMKTKETSSTTVVGGGTAR